ncbi:Ligand-binding SRPBCC domain-containing protein [Chitinophaga jiangningensis]|uniref:Ligand-binding SRPBCC domain-containing protein n=1 Tax=Chitinophaga jiangningensis TaxID=1419482 RepID=A0A1M7E8R9_9BACT|nr:SRPBCC family protein [Chitinophaga jiangningensis]SHL88060.1 Ligand-binding SRPBCC domain-containing protein [Chitinophaga jiangningensis]
MPTIHLTTVIHAPRERVFDLSRSIGLHKKSMERTKEEPIKGKTSGLISLGEWVTWQAKHLGKLRQLTTKITAMDKNVHFTDEMEEGDFTFMKHDHYYKEIGNGTVMIDLMEFGTPYGWLGRMVERFYLVNYMTKLLCLRNDTIKEYAESDKWRVILD